MHRQGGHGQDLERADRGDLGGTMSGGIIFDLYALGFAGALAAFVGLGALVWGRIHRVTPYDWAKSCPELVEREHHHVRIVK